MNSSFPAIFLVLIIVYFLNKNNEIEQKPVIEDAFEEEEPEKEIYYYSNGRLLPYAHVFYYYDMLNINPFNQITDNIIENAFTKRYSLINKIDYDSYWPISTRDVKAAKSYLIDRLNYLKHLN